MPHDAFLTAADSVPTPHRILELAQAFSASLMATALRCHNLCGVSVFQLEAAKFAWGYGIVRSAPALRDDGIQELLAAATTDQSGELRVPLVHRFKVAMWRAQWSSLGPDRTIFLLRPLSREAQSCDGNSLFSRNGSAVSG